ncbi:MAG: nitroreductase family protein [Acutalibacteraceae bacterium]
MDLYNAMLERNSVRRYTDEPLRAEHTKSLNDAIEKVNMESGLHFQLVTNEPEAFNGKAASYGHFSGCTDYIVAVGPKGKDEEIGYYGEELVLTAQSLGINSCWVALTFSKRKVKAQINKGEKFYLVISIGYGIHQGRPHKNKPFEDVCSCETEMPEWFKNGVNAALTAPTAMNQQKFHFTLKVNDIVKAKAQTGPYSKIDLGIVKYHFELGIKDYKFKWE